LQMFVILMSFNKFELEMLVKILWVPMYLQYLYIFIIATYEELYIKCSSSLTLQN